jgi:hypothetical protein
MSTKYLTLSALCVLIFCMLLALSGTAELPGKGSGQNLIRQDDQLSGLFRSDAKSSTRTFLLRDWSEPKGHPLRVTGLETLEEIIQSRAVRVMGALLLIGWVFASYRILTSTF